LAQAKEVHPMQLVEVAQMVADSKLAVGVAVEAPLDCLG
jgi:hypothetical protein